MTDADDGSERCWLVARSYDDRNLVTIVDATTDGERARRKELSGAMLDRTAVTAAEDVHPEKLEPVTDAETRERYAEEADRMRDRHEPDDEV